MATETSTMTAQTTATAHVGVSEGRYFMFQAITRTGKWFPFWGRTQKTPTQIKLLYVPSYHQDRQMVPILGQNTKDTDADKKPIISYHMACH
uniref:Uncharacterized protein n=1 Tax=Oryza barthii TaxID=65489 RepID=A0A0D3FD96_9ORYZ